jgi:light-regulated signal transduction histidine kinase (bacteriophytochrome)
MILDITERKQMEEELNKGSERIKNFAFSVSHDLKSPSIGIYGLAKRLREEYGRISEDKGKIYCDQILRAAEQIATLVHHVNVYITTSEAPLRIEIISLKEIIKEVRNEFSPKLSDRQITLSSPEKLPQIRADRLLLIRVLRNLIDNALKYGGENLSLISIGYRETNEEYILSISDDGVGIGFEYSDKIFEVFQRHETSRGKEGTGMGLAIVKEIAERHGGRVWLDTEQERGVTIHVSFSKNMVPEPESGGTG